MKNKHLIANEIVIFFKALRISALIGIVTVIIMYFGFYQAYKCFNPDVTNAKIVPEGGYSTASRIYYGDTFYRRVYKYYHWSTSPRSTYGLQEEIKECCKLWLKDRLIHSILFGLATFLAVPIFVVFIRLIYRTFIISKNWIDKNKTI